MRTSTAIQNQEQKRGAALLTLMIIVLLVAGTGAYLVQDAKQQAYAVTRVRDYLKAQAYAEGGANAAYSLLKTNFALRTDASRFPETSYGDGTYDVTVSSISTNLASITCIGQRGRATVAVMVDLQNFAAGVGTPGSTSTVPPAVGAYTHPLLAGNNVVLGGNGNLIIGGGTAHANNQYSQIGAKDVQGDVSSSVGILVQGSGDIVGDATAPMVDDKHGHITGVTTEEPVPLETIPDIDLTPYYNEALANGQVFVGNMDVSASPPGGIIWVDGDLTISGGANLEGCFIATGDIKATANGTVSKFDNYPLLVSRDGNIKITSVAVWNGLIYAKTGNFVKTGNGAVNGTIIANGNVEGQGGWDYLNWVNSTPVPPASSSDGTSASGDRVGVIAWQK